ncbi:MAG: radical SAM family heme chaperone HemW [Rhodospirillaceae bacterium]|nr:radical SAM family heme chaperone HemW [Rhodospirillaceae bacterium]
MTTAATSASATDPHDEGFGLYVHWPFCVSKCPYCDFNSHVAERIEQRAWHEAYLRELGHFAAQTAGRTLTSIFFGGGTPSLMDPSTAEAVIAAAKAHWSALPDLEITLEANPGTVDAARFQAIRDAGVNRLSMGVQSLNERDLQFLGRKHSVDEARTAWRAAAKIFPRVSFDLIYARPGQDGASWRGELAEALREVRDNGISHLSLYQLTMEEGTAMAADHARGAFALPDDDTAADMFEATQELCEAAGFPAYEISNHAAPGQECRHNLIYWRGGDYVGIGPGAHGRLTLPTGAAATRQIKAPALWLKRVAADGHGTQDVEAIDTHARAEELMMMGLRLTEGVHIARFERLAGVTFDTVIDAAACERLMVQGFLEKKNGRLIATPGGRLALNEVLRQLLAR